MAVSKSAGGEPAGRQAPSMGPAGGRHRGRQTLVVQPPLAVHVHAVPPDGMATDVAFDRDQSGQCWSWIVPRTIAFDSSALVLPPLLPLFRELPVMHAQNVEPRRDLRK